VKRAVFKFKPFSTKQLKVLTWWLPESPMNDMDGIIADGAIRSGKTLSMALSFMLWSMTCFNGEHFGLCGKTILAFRRNVLSFLRLMLWARGYTNHYDRSENRLDVRRGKVANTFWVFGGKDERSQDLIQGMTLAGCLFDETAIMPESFVTQATARCSVEGAKLWFNCNPEGPLHWFKVNWIDKAAAKNLLYLHFTMDDNLSLSEKVKARYRSMYTGVFWKRFIDGVWAIAEGIIYEMFDPDRHVLTEINRDDIDPNAPKYITIDYGTQNPTVFHLWERLKDGRWVCTKEYYYCGRDTGRQKTDSEYADDYEAFIPRDEEGKPIDITWTIVDPSAASFIAELKKRGVTVRNANNDVLNGIRLMRTLLSLELLVYSDSCTYAIGEFGMYAWDEKAAARGEDAPVKESDHCMDADRYFVNTVVRRERKWAEAA